MIAFIKANALHLAYVALFAVAALGVHSWIAEHDARIQADTTVKAEQATIEALKASQSNVAKTAAAQVIVLKQEAVKVVTVPQAIADIPKVSTVDLHPVAVADAPDKVSVDAVPLDHELNGAKQDAVNLAACTSELADEKDVSAAEALEVKALKKKPGFWHRAKSTAITVGIGVAVGFIAAHH